MPKDLESYWKQAEIDYFKTLMALAYHREEFQLNEDGHLVGKSHIKRINDLKDRPKKIKVYSKVK
jgi:hypothetical protein